MKKTLLVSLAIGIGMGFVGSVDAYKAEADEAPYSYANKQDSQEQLNKAVRLRWGRYNSEEQRGLEEKNTLFQRMLHRLSLKDNNVNEQSTSVRRSGELTDFSRTQPTTKNAYYVNNANRNFRARAYDYYVEGGDAGTDSLKEGVIFGSTHKVPTMFPAWSSGDPYTIKTIRTVQKNISGKGDSASWSASAKQRAIRALPNNMYRNFSHPYMSNDPEFKY
ncbi:hypothetical protein K9M41_01085 [Candidatus Gracilibacteria bacterium]|nr:hypothetical protein [Candidatus Gracilibacteria bacterium]